MSDSFPAATNLTDPVQLVKLLEDGAQGINRQADATGNTPMGGHPSPEFFYRRLAEAIRAATSLIRAHVPTGRPGKWVGEKWVDAVEEEPKEAKKEKATPPEKKPVEK